MKREELLIEPRELLAKLGDPRLRIYDSTIMFYMGMSAEEAAKLPSAREIYLGGHLPGAAFSTTSWSPIRSANTSTRSRRTAC